MNSKEKWNRIVDFHKKYFRSPESTIQSVWENVFVEILGYSRLDGEVERHRSIYLGSTERVIPDIKNITPNKIRQTPKPPKRLIPIAISINATIPQTSLLTQSISNP